MRLGSEPLNAPSSRSVARDHAGSSARASTDLAPGAGPSQARNSRATRRPQCGDGRAAGDVFRRRCTWGTCSDSNNSNQDDDCGICRIDGMTATPFDVRRYRAILQILQSSFLVVVVFPAPDVSAAPPAADVRSYALPPAQVSFTPIDTRLPNARPQSRTAQAPVR